MAPDADDVLEQLSAWLDDGQRAALATVIETWGSAPCPAGSQLAVAEDGRFVGSVSGGCVESAVVKAAQGVIAEGRARTLEFGVGNEDAWQLGLACGGQIQIHLEPIT